MGDWLGDAARRAAARGRVIPNSGPRALTASDLFRMSPAQIRAAQGLPPEPVSPDFGGGNRGESAATPREPGMNEILREVGALRKERKASRYGY